jgi:imidazolonepropionase-like amidohydrolase
MQLMREGYRRLELFVREFRRAGGVVLAGSDNLNGVAGLTLHRELESLVAAGLTPIEALIAATRDAARFLRREDIGTIEPGKAADLLILGASPLDNIRNLSSIKKVFQSGRELDTSFHRDYGLPPARPSLVRPLLLERLLAAEN